MFRIRDEHDYGAERGEGTKIVFGELTFPEDGFCLRYEEAEGDLAGCTTHLTCTGSTLVSVVRTGPVATELTVEPGRRHSCPYETEYGTLLLGVTGEQVEADLDEQGGELRFSYTIDHDGDIVARNTLHITVKETF